MRTSVPHSNEQRDSTGNDEEMLINVEMMGVLISPVLVSLEVLAPRPPGVHTSGARRVHHTSPMSHNEMAAP